MKEVTIRFEDDALFELFEEAINNYCDCGPPGEEYPSDNVSTMRAIVNSAIERANEPNL